MVSSQALTKHYPEKGKQKVTGRYAARQQCWHINVNLAKKTKVKQEKNSGTDKTLCQSTQQETELECQDM